MLSFQRYISEKDCQNRFFTKATIHCVFVECVVFLCSVCTGKKRQRLLKSLLFFWAADGERRMRCSGHFWHESITTLACSHLSDLWCFSPPPVIVFHLALRYLKDMGLRLERYRLIFDSFYTTIFWSKDFFCLLWHRIESSLDSNW